jgi:dTDP-4-amino-4,6-dideoxygalactose transaminase
MSTPAPSIEPPRTSVEPVETHRAQTPLAEPLTPLVEPVETRGAVTASHALPPVPFFDLALQHATLAGALDDAMRAVVHSGRCTLGPVVASFEAEFAPWTGARHVVGVGSGTDALLLALRSLDLRPGSEVVTSPFTFVATASAIVHAGLRPVFADIDPRTWCLDPTATESVLTGNSAAILPVHLFGAMASMRDFSTLARARGLRLLEDAAQACGSSREGVPAGCGGDLAAFSFYPTKNLGAAGDAGAVSTDDLDLAERIRLLRGHGDAGRFDHVAIGGTHRLDALQAAVLRVKLPHLASWLHQREAIARFYLDGLAGSGFQLPAAEPGRTWNQFCVRHPRRDALREHLRARGIAAEVYYPVPLHLQPCFRDLGYAQGDLPVAEALAREILALPIYPGMPASHRERVLEALLEFDRPSRTRTAP